MKIKRSKLVIFKLPLSPFTSGLNLNYNLSFIDDIIDYLSINKGIDKESICNHIKNNFREILL